MVPRTKISIAIFSTLLVAASVIGILATLNSIKPATFSPGHALLKTSCDSTLYPTTCYQSLSSVPGVVQKLVTQKDVIQAALTLAIGIVEQNYFAIKKVRDTRPRLTVREKVAIHDCLVTVDETLDELRSAKEDLKLYPSRKKSLREDADDLKTLLSASITNQVTCIDGFSHDALDREIRSLLLAGEDHSRRLCSVALALIRNQTDTDIAAAAMLNGKEERRLPEMESIEHAWPEWLSGGDRKLLQTGTTSVDVVVSADGSGDYKTIMDAVNAAPDKGTKRYVIEIKAGVYRENVEVNKKKTNIMFLGSGRKNTIITGSRNVKDGSTTFNSATVAAVGEYFLARRITFQNTAGASKHQAVALRVGSDHSAFYECDMLAYQDTLYVHSNRQFYINCLIVGTVDFIFGNAAAVLQDCDIHARKPDPGQKNMVTAQGRSDPNQNTGIVIHKSRIGATSDLKSVLSSFPTYLGRPWKEYSRTVVIQCTISEVIHAAGWHEWSGNFALNTLFYGEYQNTGPGANASGRVTWKGFSVISNANVARGFGPRMFLDGASWLPSTGFPYSLDL